MKSKRLQISLSALFVLLLLVAMLAWAVHERIARRRAEERLLPAQAAARQAQQLAEASLLPVPLTPDVQVRFAVAEIKAANAEYQNALRVNQVVPGTISQSRVAELKSRIGRAAEQLSAIVAGETTLNSQLDMKSASARLEAAEREYTAALEANRRVRGTFAAGDVHLLKLRMERAILEIEVINEAN